ncbi:Hypothetical predicted protein [Podarcis lilfordi]|uniref:Uncharacterized protein n=1 Tax=Podarcis lilfordi TaxID=74358 RepID=A0AA35NWZ6_9SAUR|nr:Hypothetical predicted protein [Podarcis lilfordi]
MKPTGPSSDASTEGNGSPRGKAAASQIPYRDFRLPSTCWRGSAMCGAREVERQKQPSLQTGRVVAARSPRLAEASKHAVILLGGAELCSLNSCRLVGRSSARRALLRQ